MPLADYQVLQASQRRSHHDATSSSTSATSITSLSCCCCCSHLSSGASAAAASVAVSTGGSASCAAAAASRQAFTCAACPASVLDMSANLEPQTGHAALVGASESAVPAAATAQPAASAAASAWKGLICCTPLYLQLFRCAAGEGSATPLSGPTSGTSCSGELIRHVAASTAAEPVSATFAACCSCCVSCLCWLAPAPAVQQSSALATAGLACCSDFAGALGVLPIAANDSGVSAERFDDVCADAGVFLF